MSEGMESAMPAGEAGFHASVAGPRDTGRACPYCRFPLKEGAQMAVCSVCGAAHHTDCWQDNGGCAVVGCVGGPSSALRVRALRTGAPPTAPQLPTASQPPMAGQQPQMPTQLPPAPTQQQAVPVSAAPPTWPPPQQASPAGRWSSPVVIAVIVLAVAVVGAAAAIVLTRSTGNGVRLLANTNTTPPLTTSTATSTPTVNSAASSAAGTAVTTNMTATVGGAPSSTGGAAPGTSSTSTTESTPAAASASSEAIPAGVSPEQMQVEIQQVLLTWHEDVVHGNYHGAWNLLSERKQIQDGREYGYATWVKNQSTLRPYLNPAGLQVVVESIERASDVAQVDVTGMGWDKPGASCTEWSGITWVKYEDGAWKYDPGYSTTSQRESEWKYRYSELLGGGC